MEDQSKVVVGAALLGGYVLGRTRKGRVALSLATYLAGRRFGLEPRQLAAEGMRRLSEVPQFAELQNQFKGEVLDASRKAATAAANRRMSSLADALSDRTARLLEPPQDEEDTDEEDTDEEVPKDGEHEERDTEDEGPGAEDEEEGDEEEEESPERKPGKEPSGKQASTRKSPAEKSAPAKKRTPAKKTTARKSAPAKKRTPAKETASNRTRRRR